MNKFGDNYFKRYKIKNTFGKEKGERPFLYSFWMRKLNKLLPDEARVLDVGCGAGYFLKHLERKFDAFGMDVSQAALKEAKNRTGSSLFLGSAEDLPFENNYVKAITAFDVVEHLSNPQAFFKHAYRILNNNGYLIISTPNPESLGSRLKLKRPQWKGAAYENRTLEWHGWRDDTHISIKTAKEWRNIINSHGFEILKDGTDTLWDVPYFKRIPFILQRIIFQSTHWILSWIFGFFSWRYGENYLCIAQKRKQ